MGVAFPITSRGLLMEWILTSKSKDIENVNLFNGRYLLISFYANRRKWLLFHWYYIETIILSTYYQEMIQV